MAQEYVYVPGLAQNLAKRPAAAQDAAQQFRALVESTFRVLAHAPSLGADRKFEEADPFMVNAVSSLLRKKAIPVDCCVELNWVVLSDKLRKMLGAPRDNLLRRPEESGTKGSRAAQRLVEERVPAIVAPKPLDVGLSDPPCTGVERVGQLKAATPPARDGADGASEKRNSKPLAVLRKGDTLYLVGHGDPRGGRLMYKCPVQGAHDCYDPKVHPVHSAACRAFHHCENWNVDPNCLAGLLILEGLPRAKILIEMVMCFGAGLSRDAEQTVQPYCQRLAGALAGFGYSHVKVAGARGMILTSADPRAGLTVRPHLNDDDKTKLVLEQGTVPWRDPTFHKTYKK